MADQSWEALKTKFAMQWIYASAELLTRPILSSAH